MSGYEREADIPWRDLGRLLVAEAVEKLFRGPEFVGFPKTTKIELQ